MTRRIPEWRLDERVVHRPTGSEGVITGVRMGQVGGVPILKATITDAHKKKIEDDAWEFDAADPLNPVADRG